MFASRFQFIAHALRGDGPFRPVVSHDGAGMAYGSGPSYLVQYPRESAEKYARRNEIAWYNSPLLSASNRFAGYLSTRPPTREIPHPLYAAIADDVDGRGNAIDVFWQQFMVDAKARGSMLMLVDMPQNTAPSLAAQMQARIAPFWTAIYPESVTDYQIGDDGKFDYVRFAGNMTQADGSRVEVVWYFDRTSWSATKPNEKRSIAQGDHPLDQCPVLIFTEAGDFPCFGPFSTIADLARRLFNLESELDEILRVSTFPLLTMQVPDNSTDSQKLAAAQAAGQTISTSNLLVHSGSTPTYVAPPEGPGRIYMDRIRDVRQQIDEIGLAVATINQQESGIAMQMRFQAVNAELSKFATRMEDFERRAWDLSRQWLGFTVAPSVEWARDYSIADLESELRILSEMTAASMPERVIVEQQKRIVSIQFASLEQEDKDEITQSIEERLRGLEVPDNVVPLRPEDPNDEVRASIVRALNG